MANFNTLAEVQTSTSGDFYHLQQGGIDYKHTRETLAGAISNARWSSTFAYTVGSEVVGSDNEKYVAVASSTGEDPSTDDGTYWRVLSRDEVAPNKIKTSQFVVAGLQADGTTPSPVPTTSVQSYAVGDEMSFGWVVTTDVVDAIIDANGNLTATSGVVEYTFNKADNETPNAASLFASVMRCTNAANSVYVQDYADGSNGISITETATTVTMVIDFSSFAGGKVFGVSEQVGRLPIDSTQSVINDLLPELLSARSWQNVTGSRVSGVTYTNDTLTDIEIQVRTLFQAVTQGITVFVDGNDITSTAISSGLSASLNISVTVPSGSSYQIDITTSGVLSRWSELRI